MREICAACVLHHEAWCTRELAIWLCIMQSCVSAAPEAEPKGPPAPVRQAPEPAADEKPNPFSFFGGMHPALEVTN